MKTLTLLDRIATDPTTFAFQDKRLKQHCSYLLELIRSDPNLRQSYEDLRVADSIIEIKSHSENIARQHDVKESYTKRVYKYSFGIIIVMYSAAIALMSIFQMLYFAIILLIPVFALTCILPVWLSAIFNTRWHVILTAFVPEIEENIGPQVTALREFNQELIFNFREFLLRNQISLHFIKIVLFSKQYQGLELIEEANFENHAQYLFELASAHSIGQVVVAPITSFDAGEDDKNDAFASLIIKEFDGENIKLHTFKYLQHERYARVNALLDRSTFLEDQKAKNFFVDVSKLDLKCRCGSHLLLNMCQICNWEKNMKFRFFFTTAQKCNCGKTTYIFSAEPQDVPWELKGLFI